MSQVLSTVGLGIVAGLAGGALGQSGAEVMVPGLLILGIASNFKIAAGTVLLTILPPLSLMAIVTYWKRKQVQVTTAVILMVTYFFAAWGGAYLTGGVKNSTLECISGVYFILIGAFFLWNSWSGKYGDNDAGSRSTN
jgi:uncharacterized protein